MLIRKTIYFILFIFFIWLAIATRKHPTWFHPFIAEYGGDIIWAGMFLFFLRLFFGRVTLWKLALVNYGLGIADETLQLYHAPWIEATRKTRIGGLLLGFDFVWSDIICYGVGTLLAFFMILLIEKIVKANVGKSYSR